MNQLFNLYLFIACIICNIYYLLLSDFASRLGSMILFIHVYIFKYLVVFLINSYSFTLLFLAPVAGFQPGCTALNICK